MSLHATAGTMAVRAGPLPFLDPGPDLLTFDFAARPGLRRPARPEPQPASSLREAIVQWLERQL